LEGVEEVPMTSPPAVATAARRAVRTQRAQRGRVEQVQAAFPRSPLRRGCGPDEVAARLDTLRGPLQAHFDEEERAHLFETIEAQAPEHSADCERLRGEHHSLMLRVDVLRQASPERRRHGGWVSDVRTWLDDLSRHESREAELLLRALDGGEPAED
jgi:hypothetical protein